MRSLHTVEPAILQERSQILIQSLLDSSLQVLFKTIQHSLNKCYHHLLPKSDF